MARPKKAEKKERKPRAPKAEAPPKAAAAPKIFNNDDPEAKALFLRHLPKVKEAREAIASATANLRNLYKTAKAQGDFTKTDFDYAIEVETAEAEAKARAKIARRLTIARYMGSDLGAQLDLFLEPDRTPASDRAYHEGESASMKGESAKPVYAPETEQYRKYMEGYHAHQGQLAKGIGKLHPAVEEDVKQTAAQRKKVEKQRAEDAEKFDAPTSGVGMTRSEFEARAAAGNGSSHFQKA